MGDCIERRTHEYADGHGGRRDGGAEGLADEVGETEGDEDDEEREGRHDERHREHDGARVGAEDEPAAAEESLARTPRTFNKSYQKFRIREHIIDEHG